MCGKRSSWLLFVSLLLLFSLPVFSSENISLSSDLASQASLELSLGSVNDLNLEPIPKQSMPQINNSAPLVERLTTQLELWMDWYKKVKAWYGRVTISWNSLKSFYMKREEAMKKALEERDKKIAALYAENSILRDSSSRDKAFFGVGGFTAGFGAGFAAGRASAGR